MSESALQRSFAGTHAVDDARYARLVAAGHEPPPDDDEALGSLRWQDDGTP